MIAESRKKPQNLEELAELQPSVKDVTEVRNGFEKVLQERGHMARYVPGILGDIGLALYGGNRALGFSFQIDIEGGEIPVFVFRRKSRHPERENLLIDIGMRTSDGERIRLMINPDNRADWVYLDRSMIGRGFRVSSPTANDLKLYKEVLRKL